MRLLFLSLSVVAFCAQLVVANTETYLLSIPYYYNILPHPDPYIDSQEHLPLRINHTHSYLYDYPIYNALSYGKYSNLVRIDRSGPSDEPNVLFVKVNNYEDNVFSSSKVIYWKLCWPTSSPYWFRLSHQFVGEDLALYLVIEYQFEGIPNSAGAQEPAKDLEFYLYGSALSKWVPLPIELVPIVAYLVDVGILLYRIIPWIMSYYFSV